MGNGPNVRFGGSLRRGSLIFVGVGGWGVFVLFESGVSGMAELKEISEVECW